MKRLLGLNGAVVAGLVLLAIAMPILGPSYWLDLAILSLIFSILAMGLNILMGYTGLDSLGQAAYYGTAAYTLGILTSRYEVSWPVAALAALAAGTGLAAVLGLIAVRLRGLLFLLVTLAFGQLLWGAANRWGSLTGGANGLSGVSAPASWLRQSEPFYYMTLAVFLVLFLVARRIIRSPFGLTLRAIRERELRSTTLGYNTYRHAYVAFVIAGFFASTAGILSASYNRFVSLRDLSIELSFESMLMVILGGAGTITGPVIGAFGITSLRFLLSTFIQQWWLIILGSIFVIATIYLPEGVTGSLPRIRDRWEQGKRRPRERPVPPLVEPALPPPVPEENESAVALAVSGLDKRFGDLRVLQGVDIVIGPGERVGLIGLNGAGKTTVFHVVSGIEEPTSGRIELFGADVTRQPTYRRAELGMTRTFQITLLYPRLTVRENMLVALMGWSHRQFRFALWKPADSVPELRIAAQRLLSMVGLEDQAETQVRYLSYGHQRQLEIAMALAGEPKLLLLDEPTAGLAHAEIDGMKAVLEQLPDNLAVLLVEHHLEVIFQLVDRVLVLHQGEVIADAPPDEIRNDANIRNLYFGLPPAGQTSGGKEL